MEIFYIPKGSDTPELKPEFYEIECFKTVRKRLRGCEGDHDGRKKLMNIKELSYIYFMTDHNSSFLLIDDKDKRIEDIKTRLGLPDDWKADQVVNECIAEIENLYNNTEGWESYDSLSSLLRWSREYIKEKTTGDESKRMAPKQAKELQSVALDIPKLIQSVNEAKSVLESQLKAGSTGRKGRTLNPFELAPPDL